MPPQEEEEFELVLGNKQLLSLFFVVVVLFAIFFSFGYTVGFSRGQQDRVAAIADPEPVREPDPGVRLPDALLEEAPEKTPAAGSGVSPEPRPIAREPRVPAAPEVKPAPVREPPPARRAAPPTKAASGVDMARSIHIQVAALRTRPDAQTLVNKLKAKNYPVVLYDKGGDGWFRVVVGPFPTVDAAKAQQRRLRTDGLDTILRNP